MEVELYTHHFTMFLEELNNAGCWEALDLLPSVRGDAYLCERLYKLHLVRLYNCRVKV